MEKKSAPRYPHLKLMAIAILWTSGVITKDGKNPAGDGRNSDRPFAKGG
ncbi:hypothetical protein [Cylindrospermopsis raciborskii]|jgi:hypothetical protein|nr:hypothetical protein [Cylindrospermopsis raciborskii]EFA68959.1 hypothetical protein CRC_02510 [Cylindrospermopsis raciborskii CS-505]BAZ91258.1 hypothetical protein NIES932_27650 [Raphidiopsis curvata NIES-932]